MNKYVLILISAIYVVLPSYVRAQGGSVPVQATAAPVTTSAARTVAPTPTFTPKPTPSATPTPTVSAGLAPSPAVSTTSNSSETDWSLIEIVAVIVAGVLGIFGIKIIRKGHPNQKQDNNRCNGIKDLLEQKKKELEDFIRNWPEEKIKAMAQEKIVGKLK